MAKFTIAITGILIGWMCMAPGYTQIEVKVDTRSNIFYSAASCWSCKDTLVNPENITSFYIMNPTLDEEGVELLQQMTHLKELWLEGNDSDDLEEWSTREFSNLVKSPDLRKIYIRRIDNTEKLRNYLKHRYKNVQVEDF